MHELALKPGDELHSTLEEAALEISLRGSSRRVDVRRFEPTQRPFFSVESERGASYQRCPLSSKLQKAVEQLLTIRVARVLSDDQSRSYLASHPEEQWLELEIRSIMPDVEPFRLRLSPAPSKGPAHAKLPGEIKVFEVEESTLRLFSMQCPPDTRNAP